MIVLLFERVRLTNAKRPGAPVLSPFVFWTLRGHFLELARDEP